MDKSYFDKYVERRGTMCVKWDGCNEQFSRPRDQDMIPMWIADMDFLCPPGVIDAVTERAKEGVYGYTMPGDEVLEAIQSWVLRRHGWEIKKEWISFSPGVVPAFNAAVQRLTHPGDGVIIQPPVYYPFANTIRDNGRFVVENPLICADGEYRMDFDGLEKLAGDPKNRLLILCSPHNPVGRVWEKEELSRLAEICLRHGIVIVSDEIHADLIMKGHKHVPTGSLSDAVAENTVACYAPSKTFNLAGLQTAFTVVPGKRLRDEFARGMQQNHIGGGSGINFFGGVALKEAYNNCEDYVDALCSYIEDNMDFMAEYFRRYLPKIKMRKGQGTYLAWVDFSALGLSQSQLEELVCAKAGIGVDFGVWFGTGGEGFARVNLACPRSILENALERLRAAFGQM